MSVATSFADVSHVHFYAATASHRRTATPLASAPRRRQVQTAASSADRRSRVLQQVAAVESSLSRLDQASPLSVAALVRERQAPAAGREEMERVSSPSSSAVSTGNDSSDSSDSSSDSSSESEDEICLSSKLSRRTAQQAALRRRHTSNILAAPLPSTAAGPAAATTVRVCQGKKCAAAGSSALLAQFSTLPGVAAALPSKCLKQCKHCVAVEMTTPAGAPATLYTRVNRANAAEMLAQHGQRSASVPAR